jgi:hypothetical protein
MQGHNTIKPNLSGQICQERAAGERYLSQSVSAQAARAAQIFLDGKEPGHEPVGAAAGEE